MKQVRDANFKCLRGSDSCLGDCSLSVRCDLCLSRLSSLHTFELGQSMALSVFYTGVNRSCKGPMICRGSMAGQGWEQRSPIVFPEKLSARFRKVARGYTARPVTSPSGVPAASTPALCCGQSVTRPGCQAGGGGGQRQGFGGVGVGHEPPTSHPPAGAGCRALCPCGGHARTLGIAFWRGSVGCSRQTGISLHVCFLSLRVPGPGHPGGRDILLLSFAGVGVEGPAVTAVLGWPPPCQRLTCAPRPA